MDESIIKQAAAISKGSGKLQRLRVAVAEGKKVKAPQVTVSHGIKRKLQPRAARPQARSVTIAAPSGREPWD